MSGSAVLFFFFLSTGDNYLKIKKQSHRGVFHGVRKLCSAADGQGSERKEAMRMKEKKFDDNRSCFGNDVPGSEENRTGSMTAGRRRRQRSQCRSGRGRRDAGKLLLILVLLLSLSGCREEEAVLLDTDDLVYQEAVIGEEMPKEQSDEQSGEQTKAQEQESVLFVHICGEVAHPGVYELPAGSRVYEAVEAAGGFTEAAEEGCINLAQVLTDGIQIEIPDEARAAELELEQEQEQSGRIDLNTATSEQLCTLPGIGASRAESIIAYREETGGFSQIEDIMQVNGIKEAMFEKIRDKIYIGVRQ